MLLAFKKVNYILKLSIEILLQIQQNQNLKISVKANTIFLYTA